MTVPAEQMVSDLAAIATYRLISTLKLVAHDVWVVDGPLIPFGPPFLKMHFPTRMTVIRLGSGELFIHSPTALDGALKAQVRALESACLNSPSATLPD